MKSPLNKKKDCNCLSVLSCLERKVLDSCGICGTGETCPAPRLRGTCHKSNRPRRQRTPSWPIRLMPPASEQSPSTFPTRRSIATRRLTARPAESEHLQRKSTGFVNGGKSTIHMFIPHTNRVITIYRTLQLKDQGRCWIKHGNRIKSKYKR